MKITEMVYNYIHTIYLHCYVKIVSSDHCFNLTHEVCYYAVAMETLQIFPWQPFTNIPI